MATTLQMKSLFKSDATVELFLDEVTVPDLQPHEVLMQVEASPINPSDLGVMFGLADIDQATTTQRDGRPVLSAPLTGGNLERFKARMDKALPVGNEGAGVIVEAGSSPEAQALKGKTVAALSGSMYAKHSRLPAASCLVLNEGTTPVEGASCFVNPLTALGMVDTMRLENHTALVHTAAASNLGQMLNRICLADGVPLVNIVRKQEQVDLLKAQGAAHVCNSSAPDFRDALTDALAETGATIGFDATGGGTLASEILMCMERAASRNAESFSTYGSMAHKQVYLYGSLDMSPTVLHRNYGMAWGIGGWLLPPFLARVGAERAGELRARVANEVKTTFASHYTDHITLEQVLDADTARRYQAKATGEKFLVRPTL